MSADVRIDVVDVDVTFAQVRALTGVSATFEGRGVCGLIGTNGAGKTTLVHTVMGLQRPTRGYVRVTGPADAMAYCPDTPSFYPYLTASETLVESARLGRRRGRVPSPEPSDLLAQVGLAEVGSRLVGGFSRGMKQRLGIAAALGREPSVLFLDEPTSALDPLGRDAVISLIAELGSRLLVVFSSHILDDVGQVADRLAVMDHGRLTYAGPRAGFAARTTDHALTIVGTRTLTELTTLLSAAGHQVRPGGEGPHSLAVDEAATPLVLRHFAAHPQDLRSISHGSSLLAEFTQWIAA